MSKSPPHNTRDSRANLVDWYGVGDMISIATERIAAPVEGMHRAIVARWFGMAGPRFEPARRVVDGATAAIYGTVRLGASAVGATVSIASRMASNHVSLRPVWETPKGRHVQSVFNGLFGDQLEDAGSPLRIGLGLRDPDGSFLPTTPPSLGRAFPNPKGRLVVMLHGFGDTERCWRSNSNPTLIDGLEADGFSVLRIRYNTGRAVIDNGSDFAALLETVVETWPVPVEEVALIGHSMGGLVARSALIAARSAAHHWVDAATHLVAIGTPHLGSPIEKGVQVTSKGLGLFKETRPLSAFLEGRSAGIKDLRHGADDRPEGVRYHVIAGVVTKEPTHPLGTLVGDLVVRVRSATGRGGQYQVEPSSVLVVGGRHHAGLLHDPEVISNARQWLTPS